ncbi:hypothetical protein GPECTOR_130g581 [Gonium pectorale]|uniref:AAA+ ATPase domain-containing protein n=1 Tax=Gonium pectorale TaxID=33097 RepID=A0A150FZX1_GONPE|nr:hypothetical protein GPECTOR_130g581 [Gonium pectorale]|eukprot:KXZ42620.1 hypothetical protein GPECTOR_130g581 [Gonium pectorale]
MTLARDAVAGERQTVSLPDDLSALAEAGQASGGRPVQAPTPRIRIDIRGSHLDDDFNVYIRREPRQTTWASISGLTDTKILLQEATVLPTLRPDLFKGIRQPPKALLLFGPPGTGKTMLARAVATESRATFLPITGSNVLSMWYGQSEQNVKALFEKARKRQPSIIFIDEVDSLLGKRSGGGPRDSTPDKRVTNEFLAFIDGIQTQQAGDTRIMVIAATNTPWDLDEAALSREAAMRPLRELWGRRLLEGSAAASCPNTGTNAAASQQRAAHERLVELVARSLASSAGAGEASAPTPCTGGVPAEGTSAAGVPSWTKRRWPLFGFGLGNRYGRSKRQARRELERWKRRHRAAWCDIDAVMQQAEQRMNGRRQATDPHAPMQQPTGAGVDKEDPEATADTPSAPQPEQVAELEPAAPTEADSIPTGSAAASAAAAAVAPATEAAALDEQEPAGDGPCAGPASGDLQPPGRSGESNGGREAGMAGATPQDAAPAAASGRPDSTATPAVAAAAGADGPAAVGASRKRPAEVVAGGEQASVQSLADLLSLPTASVRPIVAEDVEASLRVISCTEMDQTARYTEWDQKYGSGAASGANSGRTSMWMSMYV